MVKNAGAVVGGLIESVDVVGRQGYLDAGNLIDHAAMQSIEVIPSPCGVYRSPS